MLRSHTWTAREHRRNKLHESGDVQAELTPFTVYDVRKFSELLKNPVEAVSLAVGPIFFLGSVLFIFGCAAEENDGFWEGKWSVPLKDWLVNIPFLVRSVQLYHSC